MRPLANLSKEHHKFDMARHRKKKKKTILRRFFYAFRYRVGEYAVRGFVAILPRVPYRLLLSYTSFSAWVTFGLLWQYRNRMIENVSVALGDQYPTLEQRKALVYLLGCFSIELDRGALVIHPGNLCKPGFWIKLKGLAA